MIDFLKKLRQQVALFVARTAQPPVLEPRATFRIGEKKGQVRLQVEKGLL